MIGRQFFHAIYKPGQFYFCQHKINQGLELEREREREREKLNFLERSNP